MKSLRVFYTPDGDIIWTHGLEGSGKFPSTIEDDLKDLPPGTEVILVGKVGATEFIKRENSKVIDGVLSLGTLIPEVELSPTLKDRLDSLEAELKAKGVI